MHIPDGFLSPLWCVLTYAASVIYFLIGSRMNREVFSPNTISLLTTLAAGIFVAQMLNWPIPGGTSLHFVGGALAGILLGPFYGSITLAMVLMVQCIVFHDGGITTLGANILNMAIIDVLIGYYIYKGMVKIMGYSNRSVFLGGFLGGWMGIFLAGIACGIEIGLSPQFPYGITITVPVMGVWHLILGVIEGFITGSILSYIYSKNPKLIHSMSGGIKY